MISVEQLLIGASVISALVAFPYAYIFIRTYMREVLRLLNLISTTTQVAQPGSLPPALDVLLKGLTDVASLNVQATAQLGKSVESFKESVFGQRGSSYSDFETPATNRRTETEEIADLIAEHGLTEQAARDRVRESRIYRKGNAA